MNAQPVAGAARSRGRNFLLLGVVLILCGLGAIFLPAVSTIAASLVLGVALVISGILKLVEARRLEGWAGSARHVVVGAIEVIGGVLISFDPMRGAIGIALVIALVFVVQGVAQIALAVRLRRQEGWQWLLVAGIIALCASALLVAKIPYTRAYTPGTVAGIALLVGGWAYVAIALATRRFRE